MTTIDTRLRGDAFPYLAERVYLDTAAAGLSWSGQGAASARFYDEFKNRGYDARPDWLQVSEATRSRVGNLLGVAPADVAWLSNTTECLNLAAHSIGWRKGDRVVLASDEFPSVLRAWDYAENQGATIVRVPVTSEAQRETNLLNALDNQTRVLAVSHVNWATGTKLDIAKLGAACRERGALLVVDGVQALGAVPVDAAHADIYCAALFKWMLSSFGLAVFVSSERARAQMAPAYRGYANIPPTAAPIGGDLPNVFAGFQYSHSNLPAIFALESTLDFFDALGWATVQQRVAEMSGLLMRRLSELGFSLVTPREARAGIVSFTVPDVEKVQQCLAARGVSVSVRGGLLRVSPHFYNQTSDIHRFCDELVSATNR